jgi:DNA excision repair protein ERCC-4
LVENARLGVKPPAVLPTVLVDSREKQPLSFSTAVSVEIVTLAVGDYSIRGFTQTVALERKRLGELATCCGVERDRFIDQLERLRIFPVRALIVEACLDGVLSKSYASEINPLSVLGTLIKASSDWQIPIWFCGDARNAALVVERMLLRVAKQAKEHSA